MLRQYAKSKSLLQDRLPVQVAVKFLISLNRKLGQLPVVEKLVSRVHRIFEFPVELGKIKTPRVPDHGEIQ